MTQHPRRADRRAKFAAIGAAITAHDKEWRIHLGQSPNPWRGRKSGYAGPTVLQIVSERPECGDVEPVLQALAEAKSMRGV